MKIYLVEADYTSSWRDIYIVSGKSEKEVENKVKILCGGALYVNIKEINADIPYYIDTHPD